MNWEKILLIVSILVDVCLGLQISVGGSKTVANIDNDEATIVLNFTYVEDVGDEINSGRSITLLRRGDGGSSSNVAGFSKPGGEDPTYYSYGEYLRNRSQLYAPTEDSESAVIVIQEVLCEDDRNEFYCRISFDNPSGPQTENSDTVMISLQKSAQQPFNYPLISTTQTQEGNAVHLACTADVGKPPGYVTWWRFRTDHSIAQISQSDFIDDDAGNCEFVSSVNTTYTVTREDNGAFFRCTSGRNVTDESGPEGSNLYRDTEKINVLYEARVTRIVRVPEMNIYPISTSQLNLTCLADGNPVPNQNDYKWTFQRIDSNTTEDMNSATNSLILYILQESQSGTYTCTVSNQLNSTHSSNITIIVNGTIPDPPLSLHCHSSPCSAMERCIDWGRGFTCETNGMAAAGVAFIVITIAVLSISVGLVYYTRKIRMKVDIHQGTKCYGENTAVSKSEAVDMKAHTGDTETHTGVKEAQTGDTEAQTGDTEAHTKDKEPSKSPSGSSVIYAKIKA